MFHFFRDSQKIATKKSRKSIKSDRINLNNSLQFFLQLKSVKFLKISDYVKFEFDFDFIAVYLVNLMQLEIFPFFGLNLWEN